MPPKKQRGRPLGRRQPGIGTVVSPGQQALRSISRRSSRPDIELMMECEEEDLSPAQVAAMNVAREEHEKANNIIKEARAGSTLVPSSQPNTFTIVPSKPVLAPPPMVKAPPLHVQANKPAANNIVDLTNKANISQRQSVNPVSHIGTQLSQPFSDVVVQMSNAGPPPRAQQFLDKHSQKKDDTPDIMIIGESPPRPNSKVVVNQSVVSPKMSMPVSGATPTQVYKFVNHSGTMATPQPPGNNQWLIRPVLTVTPQQNQIEKMRHKQQLELRLEQQRQELKHQQIMAAGLQLTKQINQISASSPLGYTMSVSGVKGQEHGIHGLPGQLLDVRMLYWRRMLLELKNADELLVIPQNTSTKLTPMRVELFLQMRAALLRYYLDRFFRKRRISQMKDCLEMFFKEKWESAPNGNTRETNERHINPNVQNPPKGPFVGQIPMNPCVSSNNQSCDMSHYKSAYSGSLKSSSEKAESGFICDKHHHVLCSCNLNSLREKICCSGCKNRDIDIDKQSLLRVFSSYYLTDAPWIAKSERNETQSMYHNCINPKRLFQSYQFYSSFGKHGLDYFDAERKERIVEGLSEGYVEHLLGQGMGYLDNALTNDLYYSCSNTDVVRPPVQILLVYPLYDFKSATSDTEHPIEQADEHPQIKTMEERLNIPSIESESNPSEHSDLIGKLPNTEPEKIEGNTKNNSAVTEKESSSIFFSSINGDLTHVEEMDSSTLDMVQVGDGSYSEDSAETKSINQELSDSSFDSKYSEESMGKMIEESVRRPSSAGKKLIESLKAVMLKSTDTPWYAGLSLVDKKKTVKLCQHNGWTSISKILHIPKMQLLTWSRELRKSAFQDKNKTVVDVTKIIDPVDVIKSKLQNIEETVKVSNDKTDDTSDKCLEKSSQDEFSCSIAKGPLSSKDNEVIPHADSGKFEAVKATKTSKTEEGNEDRASLFKNYNSDGRLHPPIIDERDFSTEKTFITDTATGPSTQLSWNIERKDQACASTSKGLTSMIDRLKKKLETAPTCGLSEMVPIQTPSIKSTESETSRNLGNDESSSDSDALVIDTEITSSSTKSTDDESDDEQDGALDYCDLEGNLETVQVSKDIGKDSEKCKDDDISVDETSTNEKKKMDNDKTEIREVVDDKKIMKDKGEKEQNFTKILSTYPRTESEKSSEMYPLDHCYLGSSAVPKQIGNLNWATENGSGVDTDSSEKEDVGNIWKPVRESGLTFPQDEWYELNGRKIRVFSSFSEDKRQMLNKHVEKRGILETSSNLKIPVDYLKSIVKTDKTDPKEELPMCILEDEPSNIYANVKTGKNVPLDNVVDQESRENVGHETYEKDNMAGMKGNDAQSTVYESVIHHMHKFSPQEGKTKAFYLVKPGNSYPGRVRKETSRLLPKTEFMKEVVKDSYYIGETETYKKYNISHKTLLHWRSMFSTEYPKKPVKNKALVTSVDPNKVMKKKFSDELKIKMVHMAKAFSINKIAHQYNISRNSIQNWTKQFFSHQLNSYELTDDELKQLVANSEYKRLAKDKRMQKKQILTDKGFLDNSVLPGPHEDEDVDILGDEIEPVTKGMMARNIGEVEDEPLRDIERNYSLSKNSGHGYEDDNQSNRNNCPSPQSEEQTETFEEIYSWQVQPGAQRPSQNSSCVQRDTVGTCKNPSDHDETKTTHSDKNDPSTLVDDSIVLSKSGLPDAPSQKLCNPNNQPSDISVVSAYYGVGAENASRGNSIDVPVVGRSVLNRLHLQIQNHIKKEPIDEDTETYKVSDKDSQPPLQFRNPSLSQSLDTMLSSRSSLLIESQVQRSVPSYSADSLTRKEPNKELITALHAKSKTERIVSLLAKSSSSSAINIADETGQVAVVKRPISTTAEPEPRVKLSKKEGVFDKPLTSRAIPEKSTDKNESYGCQTVNQEHVGKKVLEDVEKHKMTKKLQMVVTEKDLKVEKALKDALMSLKERNKTNTDPSKSKMVVTEHKKSESVQYEENVKQKILTGQSLDKQLPSGRINDLIQNISKRVQDADKELEINTVIHKDTDEETTSTEDGFESEHGILDEDSEEKNAPSAVATINSSADTPNLSDKLKSILDADIFANIEDIGKESVSVDNDSEDLINILGTSKSESIEKDKRDEEKQNPSESKGTKCGHEPSKLRIGDDKETSKIKVSPNSQKRCYPESIRTKLGLLSNRLGVSHVHRKYKVASSSLFKWKELYKSTKIENLELSPEEMDELKMVQESNSSSLKADEHYDIYIDNPENDSDCIVIEDSPVKVQSNIHSNAPPVTTAQQEGNTTKSWKSVSHKIGLQKMFEAADKIDKKKTPTLAEVVVIPNAPMPRSPVSRGSVPNIFRKSVKTPSPSKKQFTSTDQGNGSQIPLYYILDENATGETKKALREKIEKPLTGGNKGVFLESSPEAPTFTPTSSNPSLNNRVFVSSYDATQSADEKESNDVDLDKPSVKTGGDFQESLIVTENTLTEPVGYQTIFDETNYMIAELNSQLRPDSLQTPPTTMANLGTVHSIDPALPMQSIAAKKIRLAELKSHFIKQGHMIEGVTISHESLQNSSTAKDLSASPKAVHVTLRRASLSPGTSEGTTKISAKRSLSLGSKDEETFDSVEKEGSFLWKWKIVSEARISGFESTALKHSIDMTDIMKWHDDFVKEKFLKTKLGAAQHAVLYGLSAAMKAFNLKRDFVLNLFQNMDKPLASTNTTKDVNTEDTSSISSQNSQASSMRKNAHKGLEFETVEKDGGKIKRPKFQSKGAIGSTVGASDLRTTQKTRMGPNTINYSSTINEPLNISDPGGEGFNKDAYNADTRADLGTMPRLIKHQVGRADGVEIASTWKQIQSVVNPLKPPEKKFSQEYKNRIIKECEEKGQKIVSKEHRIPYNEISRWRLDARKLMLSKMKPLDSSRSQDKTHHNISSRTREESASYPKRSATTENTIDKGVFKSSSIETSSGKEPEREKEPLKIKINLKKVTKEKVNFKPLRAHSLAAVGKPVASQSPKKRDKKTDSKGSSPEADLKLQVVDYCTQFGVLKTQKKFGLIRQSIVDLMQEYDNYCKTSFDYVTRSEDIKNFKTRLVSRDKTSVEESQSYKPPVIMHNLKDYIVTQEYKDSVAEYAREHGITAATRKFKRKSTTVKSWMGHYAQRLRKMKKVEELMKQAQAEFGVKEKESDTNLDNSNSTAVSKSPRTQEPLEPSSPVWDLDFVIKPSSGKSPLKMTLSPRRKSPVVMLSADEEQKEIETDGEGDVTEEYEGDATEEYEEVHEGREHKDRESKSQNSNERDKANHLATSNVTDDGDECGNGKMEVNSGKGVVSESTLLISPKDVPNILEMNELFSGGLDSTGSSNKVEETTAEYNLESADQPCGPVSRIDVQNSDLNSKESTTGDKNITDENPGKSFDHTKSDTLNEESQQMQGQIDVIDKTVIEISDDASHDTVIADSQLKDHSTAETYNTETSEDCVKGKTPRTTAKHDSIVEETREEIPFEETLMFKLDRLDVDLFFTRKESPAVSVIPKTDSKLNTHHIGSVKEKAKSGVRRGADFEIVRDIGQTCMFGSSRLSRPDAYETDMTVSEDTNCNEEENKDKGNDQEKVCAKKLDVESIKDVNADLVQDVEIPDPNKCSEADERVVLLTEGDVQNILNNKDCEGPPINAQASGTPDRVEKNEKERSLFDFFSPVPKEEKPKESVKDSVTSSPITLYKDKSEKDSEKIESKQVEEATSDVETGSSAFSLFGNLMKSFKLPTNLSLKKDDSPIMKQSKIDLNESQVNKKIVDVDKETKVKDRSERNLFDFILPVPVREKETEVNEKIDMEKGSKGSNKTTDEKSLNTPPEKKGAVQSMFKFNKLPLFNFGNIAKLGIAQLKKDDSKLKLDDDQAKKSKNSQTDEKYTSYLETYQVTSTLVEESDGEKGNEPKPKAAKASKLDKVVGEPKPGVVMETFEELRQRLAQERAANKLGKEVRTDVASTQMKPDSVKHDVDNSNRAIKTNEESFNACASDKIDYEKYKEFPAQKVTLIVDIAKKHGIEFASTSFGLPVPVIINWIIEKDRKHRKIAAGTTLETKLMVVGEMEKVEVKDFHKLAAKHNIELFNLLNWKKELMWLIDRKDVKDVLNKWQTVESMTSLENPTRRSRYSVSSKSESESVSAVSCNVGNGMQSGIGKFDEVDGGKIDKKKCPADRSGQNVKENNEGVTEDKDTTGKLACDIDVSEKLTGSKDLEECNLFKHGIDKKEKTEDRLELDKDMSIKIKFEETHEEKMVEFKTNEDQLIENKSAGEEEKMQASEDKEIAQELNLTNEDIVHRNTENVDKGDKVPDILEFTSHLNPRDYSIEQKAMIVLLVEKFGIRGVHDKLGINKGTLWTWRNQNRGVKQYIDEQRTGIRVKKVVIGTEKTSAATNISSTRQEVPIACQKGVGHVSRSRKVGSSQRKGYRLISPSKIPSILQNVTMIATKDFTFEQRIAIVKLVELYGVRTVHKQFRIPQGSIWNWQHAKNITEELKKDEGDLEISPAKRNLQFGTAEFDPNSLNIDVILDRVMVAVETTNNLNFNYDQKSDTVCLIDHFGLQYVCNKLPQIPRGTLWNWCHNKYVRSLVEKKMAAIAESQAKESVRLNTKKMDSQKKADVVSDDRMSEPATSEFPSVKSDEFKAPISEVIDKVAFTEDWVSSIPHNTTTLKRKADNSNANRRTWNSGGGGTYSVEGGANSTGGGAKKQCIRPEKNEEYVTGVGLDGVCSERDFLRSLGRSSVVGSSSGRSKDQYGTRTRTSSFSSFSSILSDQTNEFEEILTDDEFNTSSTYSKHEGGDGSVITKETITQQHAHSTLHGTLVPELRWNFLSSLTPDDINMDKENVFEVHQIEEGAHSKLMVAYKIVENEGDESARKKARKESDGEIDQSSQWVPLDEYYYGTLDGDAAYAEEKGEFRFKCWYCSKMLYNNVRAMQHIQGHIDSSKQQNIDLSDLTQCKHCYIQFDTPFQMQTHAEKVHLGNKVLTCRICEKAFGTTKELIMHMRQQHLPCEMPYGCQLCGFKSSMYSDVVDHFKKKHDSSQNMLCLYCLRVFKIKFTNQGWGQTQTYYGHLLKHQVKSSMKKCNTCRLMFFNPLDVKGHKKSCHISHYDNMKDLSGLKSSGDDQLMIKVSALDRRSGAVSNRSSSGSIRGSGASHKGGNISNKGKYSHLKSLNAPSITKIQDYGDVSLPRETTKSFCIECKMTMSSTDHYKKHINCSLCRFATSCSVAYAQHMLFYHSGQVSSLNLKIPWERPMKQVMFCACGFSSKYGTKMANHLVSCGKQTCSEVKPSAGAVSISMESKKDDSQNAGGIFGALGLVQKKPMITRVNTPDSERGELKSETKSENNAALKTKETPMEKESEAGDTEVEIVGFVPGGKENITSKVVVPEKKYTDEKSEAEKPEPIEIDDDNDNIKSEDAKEIKQDDKKTIVIDVEKEKDKGNQKVEDKQNPCKEDIKTEKTVTELDAEIDDSKDMSEENTRKDNNTDVPDDDNEVIAKVEEMEDKNVTSQESHDVEKSTDIADESMECEESNAKGQVTDNVEGKSFDAGVEKQTDDVQPAKTEDNDDQVDNNKSEADEMSNASFITLDNTLESDVAEESKGKEEKIEPRANADTHRNADEKEGMETDPTNGQLEGNASITDISMVDSEILDTGEDENGRSQQDTTDTKPLKDDTNTDGCLKQVHDDPDNTGADKPDSGGGTPSGSGDKADDSKLDGRTATDTSVTPTGDTAEETKETEDVTAREDEQTQGSAQRQEEERVRHKSGDSQRSDTSSRSSQGQQEHRSHGGHHHGDRSHDRYQRDDRHGANRSDDYHVNQSSYDRNRDRDRSHDRDHHRGNNHHDNRYGSDHRGGYGQGHRGQGYRGQGGNRGQYGGYHQGNRGRGGGHHQDWNYNRNQGNQGGYRGGYRGGYY